MRLAILMFVAGTSLSTAAVAQSDPAGTMPADMPMETSRSSSHYGDATYSFTGLRAEFLGGYNRQLPDVKTNGPVLTTSRAMRHTGGSAGVQGGFDIELGPVVAGAFGGYALVTSQDCGALIGLNQGCLRPTAEAEGGVRVGLQLRSRFLAYAKGSYVNTRIETRNLSGASLPKSHVNKDGYRVGGGVEFAVAPHAYIKTEYDYTRTERFSAIPYGFQNTSISYHSHAVRGGFGVRF